MKDGVLTMVMLASVLCHVPAAAQTAATRDREPVVFISRAGMAGEVRGDLIALDDTTVTLRVDGRQLSLPLARVTRIQREGDNLRNGALIGGIVLGLCCAIVCGQGLDDAGQLPMAVAVNGALGALVGAGIDAAQKGRTTIYPAVPVRGEIRPDPALGLAFTVRF